MLVSIWGVTTPIYASRVGSLRARYVFFHVPAKLDGELDTNSLMLSGA